MKKTNNVCIFIYSLDGDTIVIDKKGNPDYFHKDLIYLLRLEDENKSHYVYIKKKSNLLNLSTHVTDKDKKFCPYCNSKIMINKFDRHISSCFNIAKDQEGTILKLPEEGTKMKFKNFKNMLMRPFIVIADMESSLIPMNHKTLLNKHEPNSCCYYFICTFDYSRNYIKTFDGENCVVNMIKELKKLSKKCIDEMRINTEMKLTKQEEEDFKNAKECYLCKKVIDKNKVRDHDHRTGFYRGACHASCNINYYSNRYLPVVFHNLRGYDGHMIIKKAYEIGCKNINAIPSSFEKFMTFNIDDLKFIDSYQFLNESLDKLTENLYDKEDKYKHFNFTKTIFGNHMDLLCKKGVYPYEWVDSHEKLNHIGLPPRSCFYSKLSNKVISLEDYNHATNVYNTLECKSFYDYHMIYLKCDVLLLADIFENFRKTCKNYYDLDPANYITAASLAWDAMLLKTNVELDLISDQSIYDIIERQKRGGLCFVGSKRHAKANNRYMEDFNPKKPEDYILYLDANNLYGWAMSQYLPYSNLEYSNDTKLEDILKTSDESDTGCILEVDLEYPKELHEKLKEFPPCPEILIPETNNFSEYQKELIKNSNYKPTKKLIPHLLKHEKYCIHYRNLKIYK